MPYGVRIQRRWNSFVQGNQECRTGTEEDKDGCRELDESMGLPK